MVRTVHACVHMWRIIKRSFSDFLDDRCQTMAAALAYYTAFSLPPLLVLLLVILGATMDPQDIQRAIEGQMQNLMGASGAEQVRDLLLQANRMPTGGVVPTTLGILALAFGATGVFGELQSSLNKTWRVAPDPKKGGVKNFIVKRLFSFTFVIGIAFLLLVSLVLSALISAFGNIVSNMVQGGLSEAVLFLLDLVLSFSIFTIVFAISFKYLPDAQVAWGDVIHGAVVTALLFLAGKFAIGFYLGRSNPGE
jgi:membrane protein